MLLLILFGLVMFVFGAIMFTKPLRFSSGIALFCEKPWFHTFEVVSRFLVGAIFLLLSANSDRPNLFVFIGVLLCFVSIFLIIIGPSRHKAFALRTSKFGKWFRPLGLVAMLCGSGLLYLSIT